MDSSFLSHLATALGPGYIIERELGGGGMSRVFVALDSTLERRVAVKVLPEHLAASVSVERFKREILMSAGLQHPHIVGVLSAGEADGLPFFVMPYVEGESLGARLLRVHRLDVRETVSILKDVARALVYAHERGVVHRDIKPHNILLAGDSATVTDFGVAKALSSARRSAQHGGAPTLTGTGTSLGTPLYMAPEQAAADPEVDHRADLYAVGITAYEMLTGHPPFASLAPRAMLAARLTQDPPPIESFRTDVPARLADLVMHCLAREPAERPKSAAHLLAVLDDPAVVSGAFARGNRRRARLTSLRGWRAVAAGLTAATVLGAVGAASISQGAPEAPPQRVALAPSSVASVVVLPLVNIGADSTNAYLAEGITNELATALGRVRGVRVVSPNRAAALLASGRAPSDVGQALNVSMQLEGTVQRDGNRLRVTARLVDVKDGVMHWSDMYERDATDLLAVQEELSRAITDAVGSVLGAGSSALAEREETRRPTSSASRVAAYDLYLRGRFQLARRGGASLRRAAQYFEQAIARDPQLAVAYSALADAQGLLPLYADVPAEPSLSAALRSADRAVALDSSVADTWASRAALNARGWHWERAERDYRRALTLNPASPSTHQGLGELLLVLGRVSEGTLALQRAAQLEPASPVIAASLAVALGLAGRSSEAVATAERAVAYDSTLMTPRFMLGAARLNARQPAAAVAPLEEALRIDPFSRTAMGMLGYAYAASGDFDAARRTRARLLGIPRGAGTEVALARIALGMGDTTQALDRLERAARARDAFFATESMASAMFDSIRRHPRYDALRQSIGLSGVPEGKRTA